MSRRLESLLDPQRRAECRRHDALEREVDRDADRIQRALLEPRTARPLTGLRRVLGFLWRLA